jgi:hypothetical protein
MVLLILLILGLVLLILLILLLLILFLLLLLFLELVDLPLHKVAIVLRIGVVGRDLQGGIVGLHGVTPGLEGVLRICLFRLLAEPVLRIAHIVIGAFLDGHLRGIETLLEASNRLRVVARLVCGGASVELKLGPRGLGRGG